MWILESFISPKLVLTSVSSNFNSLTQPFFYHLDGKLTNVTRFFCRDAQVLENSRDQSGSLLALDPRTNQTRVLLRGLALASGVAVSRDGSYVLVSEYLAHRIRRFWLRGPRANSSELFVPLRGRPDNIRRNSRGQFWVAVSGAVGPNPPARPTIVPRGVRIGPNGGVLQTVSLVREFGSQGVSEVHEHNGTLFCGSLQASFVAITTML